MIPLHQRRLKTSMLLNVWLYLFQTSITLQQPFISDYYPISIAICVVHTVKYDRTTTDVNKCRRFAVFRSRRRRQQRFDCASILRRKQRNTRMYVSRGPSKFAASTRRGEHDLAYICAYMTPPRTFYVSFERGESAEFFNDVLLYFQVSRNR